MNVLMHANRWPALELSQDASKYFDIHHTVADTIDKVNPADMRTNTAAWAAIAWLAAQANERFERVDLERER